MMMNLSFGDYGCGRNAATEMPEGAVSGDTMQEEMGSGAGENRSVCGGRRADAEGVWAERPGREVLDTCPALFDAKWQSRRFANNIWMRLAR